MTHLPKFSPALLHPRYWLLWLGIGLLWLVVQLPYPLIYRLGNAIGRLAIGVLVARKVRIHTLEIDTLRVRRLEIIEPNGERTTARVD